MNRTEVDDLREHLERALSRDPSGRSRAANIVTWASQVGSVRKENQDRVLVGRSADGLMVAILADGMGGMQDGARAAAVAASCAMSHCMYHSYSSVEVVLTHAMAAANNAVHERYRGRGGAAMVMAAWSSSSCVIAHAGDCRAYGLDAAGGLSLLTIDDTVDAQLRHLGRFPRTGHGTDSGLLQFIGIGSEIEPHINILLERPRGLILTTDGVHGLPPDVLRWIVTGATHLQSLADRLVTASDWQGGRDNATAVCIATQMQPEPEQRPAIECWLPGGQVVVIRGRERGSIIPSRPVGAGHLQPGDAHVEKKSSKRGKKSSTAANKKKAVPQLPIVTFDGDENEDAGNDQSANRRKSAKGEPTK